MPSSNIVEEIEIDSSRKAEKTCFSIKTRMISFKQGPSYWTCFRVLLPIYLLSACLTPSSDCDEVFNYLEPAHFLLHKFGFQTWEYTPQFALRSYVYLFPHLIPLSFTSSLFTFTSSHIISFYSLRFTLAILSTISLSTFPSSLQTVFPSPIPHLTLFFLAISPGLFRASIEFLPSSTSLLLLAPALSFWFRRQFTPLIVFLVACSTLFSWLYSALLAVPLAIHLLLHPTFGIIRFIRYSFLSLILLLLLICPLDSFFYQKPVFPPLNHLLYNVFPPPNSGPHLYGLEPFSYYLLNLFLNTTISLPCFLLYPLLLPFLPVVSLSRRLVFLSPPYLFFLVFALQPHKEERFLVPIYPYLALIPAVFFYDLHSILKPFLPVRLFRRLTRLILSIILLLTFTISLSRTFMQLYAFRAPLKAWTFLSHVELQDGLAPRNFSLHTHSHRHINICVGAEWYRFPSSFFVPNSTFKVRFVRASFTGLLPRPFLQTKNATSVVRMGFNGLNQEEEGQYYDWNNSDGCHYMVHLDLSHRHGQKTQDEQPIRKEARHIVFDTPFLDADMSKVGWRSFYVPALAKHKLIWARYQVIRNLDLLPITGMT